MCILCSCRAWCRRGSSALPWLIIPLLLLWSLSALLLLPPRLRVELTSPRLACALLLLAFLSWHQLLAPRLSLLRDRHSARRRDRHLLHALHLHHLRKTATRRCRNCLTPYHDQSPPLSTGRYTCSACGHLSRRPLLDPASPRPAAPHAWWDRALSLWTALSSLPAASASPASASAAPVLKETRGERARRKAEEKRQARLEREVLEEEERKQREEVARLVEERRRLRDEVLEAEKESLRRSASVGKKEKRRGRRNEAASSSKSNSDCEELEKRTVREREGKQTFDRKATTAAESEKPRLPTKNVGLDRTKVAYSSSPRGFKAFASAMKANKPVFDHGSRKDFHFHSAGNAAGKGTPNGDGRRNAANVSRPVASDVQPRLSTSKRSWLQLFTRSSAVSPCLDANSSHLQTQSVHVTDQRTTAVSPCLDANSNHLQTQSVRVTDQRTAALSPCLDANSNHLQTQSVRVTDQRTSTDYYLDRGQSLPFVGYPLINCQSDSYPVSQLAAGYTSPTFRGSRQGFISDDADVFEDPCFVPDPVNLFAPVSASLDNVPPYPGLGFVANNKMEEPHLLKKGPVPADINKPSPIQSPLSRLKVSRERHSVPGELSKGICGSKVDDTCNGHEAGTWHMWGSPLAQNGLGLVGGTNWLSPIGQKSRQDDAKVSLLHDSLVSHTSKQSSFAIGRQVPQSGPMGHYQNGGICSTFGQLPDVSDMLVQRSLLPTLPADGDNCSFPLNQMDKLLLSEGGCETPNGSASSENSESSAANYWYRRGCTSQVMEDVGNSPIDIPCIGVPFATNQDVQPLWSFT